MFSFSLRMLLRQFHERHQSKSDGNETTYTGIPSKGSGQTQPPLLQRPRLIVSRNGETLQRVAMAQQIKLVLGVDADVGYNKGGGREEYVIYPLPVLIMVSTDLHCAHDSVTLHFHPGHSHLRARLKLVANCYRNMEDALLTMPITVLLCFTRGSFLTFTRSRKTSFFASYSTAARDMPMHT